MKQFLSGFMLSLLLAGLFSYKKEHPRKNAKQKIQDTLAILNMPEDGWLDYKAKIMDVVPGSSLPDPHLEPTILTPEGPFNFGAVNMSAKVGEGNGYGTMETLHKYIRTVMKGQNVLKPATVRLMQKSVTAANPNYGLGCSYYKNLGYGHTGSLLGSLALLSFDPDYDASVVVMAPSADFRSVASALTCLNSMTDAAYAAR